MESKDAGLLGLVAGWVAGVGITVAACLGCPGVTEVKTFQEENRPAIMRVYRSGSDAIMVDPEKDGTYITLDKYLGTFKDKAERFLEEAKILKTVEWYKK